MADDAVTLSGALDSAGLGEDVDVEAMGEREFQMRADLAGMLHEHERCDPPSSDGDNTAGR